MTVPYSARILEHFRSPRNRRTIDRPTISQEGSNPLCGDRVRLELLVEASIVREAGFTADACAVCIAAASVLTELVSGAPLDEIETLTTDDIVRQLDAALPRARVACAALPLTVLHSGLAMYRKETSLS